MIEHEKQKTEGKKQGKKVIKNVKDLKVYQLSYQPAMEIFEIRKKFPNLNDSIGSSEETRGWLDFAKDCMHITKNKHDKLDNGYDQVNAMLYSLMNNWQTFSNN
jgi:hypothetical protein